MNTDSLIPAAQYLRVSTDQQQYSLDNQADAIRRYAEKCGFMVTRTYTDAAKSGVHFKKRAALRQLLKDVVEGSREYRAILVYDVTRWGRFQDTDESAHYEFLCKSSGVPVHYCAETFENDNNMPTLIMKALKRTMAGEYSRELSVKVRAGLARLVSKGYKPGGPAIYGMRRMLLSSTGEAKRLLNDGERKCVATERVILVPGSSAEIAVVRRIFLEYTEEYRTPRSIAVRLNNDGIPFVRGLRWSGAAVCRILRQPAYVGRLVWGRTRGFLGTNVKRTLPQEWVVCQGAFQGIIEEELFSRAQQVIVRPVFGLSKDQMLARLRVVLNTEGKLSREIINNAKNCPGVTTCHSRFGGLLNVYKHLGYSRPELFSAATFRQRLLLLRRDLIGGLAGSSGGQFEEFHSKRVFRALLRQCQSGLLVSVILARCYSTKRRGLRWIVSQPTNERGRVTVLAMLDCTNSYVKQIRVFPGIYTRQLDMRVGENSEWLKSGLLLQALKDFPSIVDEAMCAKHLDRLSH